VWRFLQTLMACGSSALRLCRTSGAIWTSRWSGSKWNRTLATRPSTPDASWESRERSEFDRCRWSFPGRLPSCLPVRSFVRLSADNPPLLICLCAFCFVVCAPCGQVFHEDLPGRGAAAGRSFRPTRLHRLLPQCRNDLSQWRHRFYTKKDHFTKTRSGQT
jgi:hypothetical protein